MVSIFLQKVIFKEKFRETLQIFMMNSGRMVISSKMFSNEEFNFEKNNEKDKKINDRKATLHTRAVFM